jgi:hypothetical protein
MLPDLQRRFSDADGHCGSARVSPVADSVFPLSSVQRSPAVERSSAAEPPSVVELPFAVEAPSVVELPFAVEPPSAVESPFAVEPPSAVELPFAVEPPSPAAEAPRPASASGCRGMTSVPGFPLHCFSLRGSPDASWCDRWSYRHFWPAGFWATARIRDCPRDRRKIARVLPAEKSSARDTALQPLWLSAHYVR